MKITLLANGAMQYRLLGAINWTLLNKNELATITVNPNQQIEFSNTSSTTFIKIGGDISELTIPTSSLTEYQLSFSDLHHLKSLDVTSSNVAIDVSGMLKNTKVTESLNLNIGLTPETIGSPFYLTDISNISNTIEVPKYATYSTFNEVDINTDHKIGAMGDIQNINSDDDGKVDLRGTTQLKTIDNSKPTFAAKNNIAIFRDGKIIPKKYDKVIPYEENSYTFEMDITQPIKSNTMSRGNPSVEFDNQNSYNDTTGYTFEMDMIQPIKASVMSRGNPDISFTLQDTTKNLNEYSFEMDMIQPISSSTNTRGNPDIPFTLQDKSKDVNSYTFEMDMIQLTKSSNMYREYMPITFPNQDTTKDSVNYTFEMDIIDAYEVQ